MILPLLVVALSVHAADITTRGGDEASFYKKHYRKSPVEEIKEKFDVAIVGGGLSGLTAATFLSDAKRKAIILEKESELGGLASGGTTAQGHNYGRGGAYWAGAFPEEDEILDMMGFPDIEKTHAIIEPIDSYLWNGKLYEKVWEQSTLNELPASFEVFHHELKMADKERLIPNQPFEDQPQLQFDSMSGTKWIQSLPDSLAKRTDEESKRISARFKADKRIPKKNPMRDAIDLLDLYCRSALGANCDQVSATALMNFYISEIETRYSSDTGSGYISTKIVEDLKKQKDFVTIKTNSRVDSIGGEHGNHDIIFTESNQKKSVKAQFVIYAAQLKFAPEIIERLKYKDPEKVEAIKQLKFSNYNVHIVNVKGHPFRATYDTWVRQKDYKPTDITDVILGRWLDPAIKGYAGMQDFKKDPPDSHGIFTLYHPHQLKNDAVHSKQLAAKAVKQFEKNFKPLLPPGQKLEITSVETSLWPYSIHIVKPGHFTKVAPLLRRPVAGIFFAHSNIGTPSLEEAVYRGHCAANNVLRRLNPEFVQEKWTSCKLE